MATYHFTDALGQALVEARAAQQRFGEALDQLEAELTAERELHRDRELRLVERAEEAEGEVSDLEVQLSELGSQADAAFARVRDLETGLQRAPELPDWVKALDAKLAGETEARRAAALRRLAEYEKWI
jgi:chromosome segregation ATPase